LVNHKGYQSGSDNSSQKYFTIWLKLTQFPNDTIFLGENTNKVVINSFYFISYVRNGVGNNQ